MDEQQTAGRAPDAELLVTSIGTSSYSPTVYEFRGQRIETRFAPVATATLCGLAGTGARAVILATPDATARYKEELSSAFEAIGMSAEWYDSGDGRDSLADLKVLEVLAEAVPPQASVTLDITFGLRNLPFLYLAALTYLVGLRQVTVRGIYYGAFELRHNGAAPIIDATHLFDLLQWYQALQALHETGHALSLARVVRELVAERYRGGQGQQWMSDLRGGVKKLARSLALGLPLEAGLAAKRIVSLTGEAPAADPLRLAAQRLKELIVPWAVQHDGKQLGRHEIVLSRRELERQLELVIWYCDHLDVPRALELLREWMVNFLLWGGDDERARAVDWLDYGNVRRFAEKKLATCSYRSKTKLAAAGEQEVADSWDRVTEWRNTLAHAGMRKKISVADPEEVKKQVAQLRAWLDHPPELAGARPLGRVWVTPLGLSRGVLYSALVHTRPDQLLVVSSAQASSAVGEVLQRCGMASLPKEVEELTDPQGDFRAARALADHWRPILAAASEVVVNLTGGTTVMQHICERLASEARDLGVSTRRIALPDRRPPDEQKREPFCLAELVEIDGSAGQGATAGSA